MYILPQKKRVHPLKNLTESFFIGDISRLLDKERYLKMIGIGRLLNKNL